MTELQWLIKILTQQKLSPALKDMFIERIGEVEAQLSKAPPQRLPMQSTIQAPSTQRLLDEALPPAPPRNIIPQEVVTSKGNGTSIRGPRKF